jgi:hypothetical protein
MDSPALSPKGLQEGQQFFPAKIHPFLSRKFIKDTRLNGVDNTERFPLCGNRVNPEPGISIVTINLEYSIRQPVPVVEITKKPPV